MKKNKDIQKSGFKIPDNYFNNFNEDLKIKIIEDQLKEKFGNKKPFTIPNNYFENFSVKVEKEKAPQKIIKLLKPFISIAAGIILIFGVWQFILTNIPENNNFANNNLNKVEETNRLNDLDCYIEDIDLFSIGDIDNEENEESLNIDISEEEISDYLIDYTDEDDFEEILASL